MEQYPLCEGSPLNSLGQHPGGKDMVMVGCRFLKAPRLEWKGGEDESPSTLPQLESRACKRNGALLSNVWRGSE